MHVRVQTPKCPVCGEQTMMLVDATQLQAWREGALIQKAFPDWSADEREMLLTGTHSDCWDKLFAEGDDE